MITRRKVLTIAAAVAVLPAASVMSAIKARQLVWAKVGHRCKYNDGSEGPPSHWVQVRKDGVLLKDAIEVNVTEGWAKRLDLNHAIRQGLTGYFREYLDHGNFTLEAVS